MSPWIHQGAELKVLDAGAPFTHSHTLSSVCVCYHGAMLLQTQGAPGIVPRAFPGQVPNRPNQNKVFVILEPETTN